MVDAGRYVAPDLYKTPSENWTSSSRPVRNAVAGDIDAVVRPIPRCSVHTPC